MSVNIYKNGKLVSLDSSANSHIHDNKSVIDKFSENADGKILYGGKQIEGTGSGGGTVSISNEVDNAIQNKTDGIYVEDKTKDITDIKTIVNKFATRRIVNGSADYCIRYSDITDVSSDSVPISDSTNNNILSCIPAYKGNIECTADNYIKLHKNKSYMIRASISTNKGISYYIVDRDGNKYNARGLTATNMNAWGDAHATIVIEPTEDTEITLITAGASEGTLLYATATWFTVEEIGKKIEVDPLEYVNVESGIEDTPVGHIISHMGTTAPKHYLICDGTTYNILDYPHLANHIKTDFGSYNYFGGDGIDTFAVPDLRNNFIRGYHGDAESISGDIGKFQSGTYIANTQVNDPIGLNPLSIVCAYGTFSNSEDETLQTSKIGVAQIQNKIENEEDRGYYYTSRPRNTAVLFCIKYEPTYFMNLTGIRIKETLWEGYVGNATSITLSDNYDNYDELVFVGVVTSGVQGGKVSRIFYTSDIGTDINDIIITIYDNRYIGGHIESDKNVFIIDYVTGPPFPALTKIYGVRYNTVQKSSEVPL